MFGNSSKILETEVAGLVFSNPLGIPYSMDRHRRLCALHTAPKAGFLVLTPPKDNVLTWIQRLKTECVSGPLKAVNVKSDIVRTFSLVYDFADLIIIDPDSDNGIDSPDLSDTVALMDELVSLRLCYEYYTPVFLRLTHGLTPEELHTLLDTSQLSGLDGVVVPSLAVAASVKEMTLGRFPVICRVQSPEEGLQAHQEGAVLLEAAPNFRGIGIKKLLKKLEKESND